MARSSRSSAAAGVLTFLVLAAGASTSAHRLDEYLQAVRVAIDPDAARIELDLTPGVAVANRVLAGIDVDRDGVISAGEASGYVARVVRGLTVQIDGAAVAIQVQGSVFPPVEALRSGDGTIQLRLRAALPVLRPGIHRLRIQNDHQPAASAYLANALVPDSDRVDVTNQRRDYNQRTLDVDYVLRDKPKTWWDFIFQQKGTP
jgi:hypothetical protein